MRGKNKEEAFQDLPNHLISVDYTCLGVFSCHILIPGCHRLDKVLKMHVNILQTEVFTYYAMFSNINAFQLI